ncbi:MAG: Gfo/Idh/MocA family oxidoreductase [Lachnospiraceae bacterium]|jgi:predicted dehydrogenase|nr:Gfo/Idh/MocA family oxidoreductase [Lachnospiraceae bacterium]
MKLGIVGNGMIVKSLLEDIREIPDVEVLAICVRRESLHSGRKLADQYHIREIYTDYSVFLTRTEIDTVYIGIISSLHYEYAKKALGAGKHVICEKPFTTEYEEAEELIRSAKKKKLFLWEACKLHYSKNFLAIKRNLGRAGRIRLVQCNYSKRSSRYDQYRQGKVPPVFDPMLSGGCLYDINMYNLHFVAALFGRPKWVRYDANIGYNGIDTSGIVTMGYEGFQAVCCGAKDSDSPSFGMIQGDEGCLRLEGPVSSSQYAEFIRNGEKQILSQETKKGTLAREMAEFSRQLSGMDYQACYDSLGQTLLVTELLVTARKDAGIVFGTDL